MNNSRLIPPDAPIVTTVALPPSKSISNRLLLMRALSGREGAAIHNLAVCDDTLAMRQALDSCEPRVDVGAAGTAMRFLAAYFASRAGRAVLLDGTARMRQRPIKILVDALRQMGAAIAYVGQEGFPPLKIEGRDLQGARLTLPGDVSSQYVSALMMLLPTVGGGEIDLTGEVISRPYIHMTARLMEEFGVQCVIDGAHIGVPAGSYVMHDCVVEADWSAASYWYALAALTPDCHIVLEGLREDSLQGDSLVRNLFRALGVRSDFDARGALHLTHVPVCNCPYYADLADTPDLAQTIVVVACLQRRPFRITGLRSLRIKETDRLEALRLELRKLGCDITIEGNDTLSWNRSPVATAATPPHISTYHDHRMAMAFAAAALLHPGLVIEDAGVVSKSYPDFWRHLAAAGFSLASV